MDEDLFAVFEDDEDTSKKKDNKDNLSNPDVKLE